MSEFRKKHVRTLSPTSGQACYFSAVRAWRSSHNKGGIMTGR